MESSPRLSEKSLIDGHFLENPIFKISESIECLEKSSDYYSITVTKRTLNCLDNLDCLDNVIHELLIVIFFCLPETFFFLYKKYKPYAQNFMKIKIESNKIENIYR